MFTSPSTRPFGKVMIMLLSLALLCVLSVGSPIASAQVVQKASAPNHRVASHRVGPDSFPSLPCTNTVGKYLDEFCSTPRVTQTCSGTQYWQVNDKNSQPIDWTKTDYSNTCVEVTYEFTFALNTCNIYFYATNGYGDAYLSYEWNDGSQHKGQLYEGNDSSYISTPIFSPHGAGAMYFTDHVTQKNWGNLALGWGRGTSDGLEEVCTI